MLDIGKLVKPGKPFTKCHSGFHNATYLHYDAAVLNILQPNSPTGRSDIAPRIKLLRAAIQDGTTKKKQNKTQKKKTRRLLFKLFFPEGKRLM